MDFLARKEEIGRLNKSLAAKGFSFIVLWGRRRVGKSRLLLEWIQKQQTGVYFVADESKDSVQRKYFSEALEERIPGISDVEYPDWRTLFKRISIDIKNGHWKGPLIIDELPYLVEAAPELPSVMQNWIDQDLKPMGFTLIIAGSSQSMMQGLALSESSPLYGRATEVIKLNPLTPKYLETALGIHSAQEIVKAYTLWGGIPRYWELAEPYGKDIEEAAHELLLRPEGVLSQEPNRLLLEEKPTAMALRPTLDIIGMGAHKSSEISGRLGVSATSLSKVLARLQELDLVEREVPFGESEKSGKRSLYKIKDPLFRVWFELISGRRGQFASSTKKERLTLLNRQMPHLLGNTWETLCRKALKNLSKLPEGIWEEPSRYWHGKGPEWDLVTMTLDDDSMILGECKWYIGSITITWIRAAIQNLIQKGIPPISASAPKNVYYYLFVPEIPKENLGLDKNVRMVSAKEVIASID